MEDLRKEAFRLLKRNRREGFSMNLKTYYSYTSPDPIHFHQWFWDSCFHALVLSEFDLKMAIRELQTLFSVQTEDGFVPHVIFWKWRIQDLAIRRWWSLETKNNLPHRTAEIQPPVAGIPLERIFHKLPYSPYIKTLVDKVYAYYIYLSTQRDPDRDNLISIITPLESGMDMLPIYDLVLDNKEHNPSLQKKKIKNLLITYKKVNWNIHKIFELEMFDVEDVSFNTIYVLGLKSLSRVLSCLGDKRACKIKDLAEKAERSIIEKMWEPSDGIFYSLMHKKGKELPLKIKTISSLFPILLKIPERMKSSLLAYIGSRKHFLSNYPIPSVSMDEESFGPLTHTRFLWRGTTWINTNWFIWEGLKRANEKELAQKIARKTRELVEKHGFCEFYDPLTGEPGKAMRGFGWSTLAIFMH